MLLTLFAVWMMEERVDVEVGSWSGDITVRRKDLRVWRVPRISTEETEQGSVELRWTWN